MSKPQETISQNSSEELEVTKPKEMVVDYQSPALHKELASIFKTMVSKSTMEDVPKSSSESKELVTKVATPSPVTQKKSRVRTSVVMNKRDITFELPKPCIVDQIDMDKLPSVDRENNPTSVLMRKLSFRERLEGWSIECRRRPNNAHELFYLHPKSSRIFRSVPEVIKFLLYETYPIYISKKKLLLIEDSNEDMPTSSADQRSEEENLRSIVEEFYKDAYNNMINSTTKDYVENNDTE